MAKPVWTLSQIIAQLDSGLHWSGSSLTYGFPTDASWFPFSEKGNFSPLNGSQQATASTAIALWDAILAPDFTRAANGASANIKYMNTVDAGYAHTYLPGGTPDAGTVWFNSTYGANTGTNNLMSPVMGSWGYLAYLHETGHALGLEHPGNYNGGNPTYAIDAQYAQDSLMYTVMSYFDGSNTGADWIASDGREYFPQTPMMHDIAAIQAMYGAESATRAGATTYGYNTTLSKTAYDFTYNPHPVLCIYDAGGTDTLDLSKSAYGCTLDLSPGSFSSTDAMTFNISIAIGTLIENAIGGSASDTILGNSLANTLIGGGGNDTLNGRSGADLMSGGIGNDTYFVDNAGDVVSEQTGAANDIDRVFSSVSLNLSDVAHVKGLVENLTLIGNASVNATGNGAANALMGNSGNNILNGAGGNDQMAGGAGDDTYYVGSAGDGVSESGGSGIDRIISTISYALSSAGGIVEKLELAGSAAINGTGNSAANALVGNAAANTMTGNNGDDRINGRGGADVLAGGSGADTFIFRDPKAGVDTVKDFIHGADTLEIFAGAFGGGLTAGAVADLLSGGNHNSAVHAGAGGYFYLEQHSGFGTLFFDPTGGAGTDAFAFAKLIGSPALTASDVHIV
jgi:serralysin